MMQNITHHKNFVTKLRIPAFCEVNAPSSSFLPHHCSAEEFYQVYPIIRPSTSSSPSKLWSRHHNAGVDTIIRVRLWRAHLSVSDSSLEETGSPSPSSGYRGCLAIVPSSESARNPRALYLLYAMSRNPQERPKPIFTCLSRPVLSRRTDNT